MKEYLKPLIVGLSIIVAVAIAVAGVVSITHNQDIISVTGLGETEFEADQIVWTAAISVENTDKLAGYKQMERDGKQVLDYLTAAGLDEKQITVSFVDMNQNFTSVYENGNYAGERFRCYVFRQSFTITSDSVDKVERISREISALIAQGINIESYSPEYYYTQLNDLKLEVIEKASADAKDRAQKVVRNAGGRLGKAQKASLGVFQITGTATDEKYSSGGTFNTQSRHKKARITVRMEYRIR